MPCSLPGKLNPMWKDAKKSALCETCGKEFKYYDTQSTGKYCSSDCCYKNKRWRGIHKTNKTNKKASNETRRKMSIAHKGRKHTKEWIEKRKKSFQKTMKKRGTVTNEYVALRNSTNYKNWRDAVFKRDGYTCQTCGCNKGGNLEAHHLIPFRFLLEESKLIKDIDLFDVDNGQTLCKECHRKTPSYAVRLKHQIDYRLLSAIKDHWTQKGSEGKFEDYYDKMIEWHIDKIKEELD